MEGNTREESREELKKTEGDAGAEPAHQSLLPLHHINTLTEHLISLRHLSRLQSFQYCVTVKKWHRAM